MSFLRTVPGSYLETDRATVNGEYAIQDPYHDYAIHFMKLMHRNYGWRAVCFYTNSTDWGMNHYRYPQLRSPELVSASYRVAPGGLPTFIEQLRNNHDIRAVVPFYEPSVVNCSQIADGLQLSWAQPAVIERFRNKRDFKHHVAQVDPTIRMNVGTLVTSATEARKLVRDCDFARFVLKPNDGYGNLDVGIFDANCSAAEVQTYWRDADRNELLLEEFISGLEYHCDGQTDTTGEVTITDVFQYIRGEVNGKENIELGSIQVPHDSSLFQQIAGYITKVIRASGLTRSPFHAEVKVDDRGPCLIECAARLVGLSAAPYVNLVHGGSLDVFDLASHYYASDKPYGDPGLNWQAYDSRIIQQVNGVAKETERLYNITGLELVESMPEFLYWLKQPVVGERIHRTNDIFGSVYMALIAASDPQELAEAAEQLRSTIGWNVRPKTLRTVARAAVSVGKRRMHQLPSWREHKMLQFKSAR